MCKRIATRVAQGQRQSIDGYHLSFLFGSGEFFIFFKKAVDNAVFKRYFTHFINK